MNFALFVTAVVAASASVSASAVPTATTAPTALPAGHPHVGGSAQNKPQFFQAPPDTADEDATLPAGTIRVELRDAKNNVLPNHLVELGIIQQSVAKGDSRKHLSATTDANGFTTWSALDNGAGFAYRVSAHEGVAAFGARPFNLPHDHGMHVVLHVYPPTSSYSQDVVIASRGEIDIEVKDDRVQIVERFQVFNGSPVAWVPNDVVLALPPDFTALNSMQQMSDIGADAVDKHGARLRGTFTPGENTVGFSWQLPYNVNDGAIELDVGLPPNMDQVVIGAAAAPGMKLDVPGFRDATAQTNEEGLRFLVTGAKLPQGEASPRKIHIALSNLPTPGPTRLIGTLLALVGVAAGIYLALKKRTQTSAKTLVKRDRARVLQEIEDLERAHTHKDIGPKTYERARRELVDDLAALLRASK